MTESTARPTAQSTPTARAPTQGTSVDLDVALKQTDELAGAVNLLKGELRGYTAPEVSGRDVRQLIAYFQRIHGFEGAIAAAMGINWPPGQT